MRLKCSVTGSARLMDARFHQKLFRSVPLLKLKRTELIKEIVPVESMRVIEDGVRREFGNSITYHYRLTSHRKKIEILEQFRRCKISIVPRGKFSSDYRTRICEL